MGLFPFRRPSQGEIPQEQLVSTLIARPSSSSSKASSSTVTPGSRRKTLVRKSSEGRKESFSAPAPIPASENPIKSLHQRRPSDLVIRDAEPTETEVLEGLLIRVGNGKRLSRIQSTAQRSPRPNLIPDSHGSSDRLHEKFKAAAASSMGPRTTSSSEQTSAVPLRPILKSTIRSHTTYNGYPQTMRALPPRPKTTFDVAPSPPSPAIQSRIPVAPLASATRSRIRIPAPTAPAPPLERVRTSSPVPEANPPSHWSPSSGGDASPDQGSITNSTRNSIRSSWLSGSNRNSLTKRWSALQQHSSSSSQSPSSPKSASPVGERLKKTQSVASIRKRGITVVSAQRIGSDRYSTLKETTPKPLAATPAPAPVPADAVAAIVTTQPTSRRSSATGARRISAGASERRRSSVTFDRKSSVPRSSSRKSSTTASLSDSPLVNRDAPLPSPPISVTSVLAPAPQNQLLEVPASSVSRPSSPSSVYVATSPRPDEAALLKRRAEGRALSVVRMSSGFPEGHPANHHARFRTFNQKVALAAGSQSSSPSDSFQRISLAPTRDSIVSSEAPTELSSTLSSPTEEIESAEILDVVPILIQGKSQATRKLSTFRLSIAEPRVELDEEPVRRGSQASWVSAESSESSDDGAVEDVSTLPIRISLTPSMEIRATKAMSVAQDNKAEQSSPSIESFSMSDLLAVHADENEAEEEIVKITPPPYEVSTPVIASVVVVPEWAPEKVDLSPIVTVLPAAPARAKPDFKLDLSSFKLNQTPRAHVRKSSIVSPTSFPLMAGFFFDPNADNDDIINIQEPMIVTPGTDIRTSFLGGPLGLPTPEVEKTLKNFDFSVPESPFDIGAYSPTATPIVRHTPPAPSPLAAAKPVIAPEPTLPTPAQVPGQIVWAQSFPLRSANENSGMSPVALGKQSQRRETYPCPATFATEPEPHRWQRAETFDVAMTMRRESRIGPDVSISHEGSRLGNPGKRGFDKVEIREWLLTSRRESVAARGQV
ncbi:hypothetical protein T439DRAFT_328247 [Meredithblackwellia eburnea MCA 4105]